MKQVWIMNPRLGSAFVAEICRERSHVSVNKEKVILL